MRGVSRLAVHDMSAWHARTFLKKLQGADALVQLTSAPLQQPNGAMSCASESTASHQRISNLWPASIQQKLHFSQ